ncbi:MAG: methyltransferase domain-containing protein [Rhizobium sp.]|nr:methyltransferase domain-containing protein [Rhizobium sp.]
MPGPLSSRLQQIIDALPLRAGLRVLEVGCGPGAMAREMSARIGNGHVLGIDRSSKAIVQAVAGSHEEIEAGRLSYRQSTAEEFVLAPDEAPFDLAVAVRVGALDGRHPAAGELARRRIRAALVAGGKLYVDGGNPIREFDLT